MAGISQHCKTGDVMAFGESVGLASKALCGLTEAAGQVRSQPCTNLRLSDLNNNNCVRPHSHCGVTQFLGYPSVSFW